MLFSARDFPTALAAVAYSDIEPGEEPQLSVSHVGNQGVDLQNTNWFLEVPVRWERGG
jgi:hypothetical protein